MSNMLDWACDEFGFELMEREFTTYEAAKAFAENLHCDWDMLSPRGTGNENHRVEWAERDGIRFVSDVESMLEYERRFRPDRHHYSSEPEIPAYLYSPC